MNTKCLVIYAAQYIYCPLFLQELIMKKYYYALFLMLVQAGLFYHFKPTEWLIFVTLILDIYFLFEFSKISESLDKAEDKLAIASRHLTEQNARVQRRNKQLEEGDLTEVILHGLAKKGSHYEYAATVRVKGRVVLVERDSLKPVSKFGNDFERSLGAPHWIKTGEEGVTEGKRTILMLGETLTY